LSCCSCCSLACRRAGERPPCAARASPRSVVGHGRRTEGHLRCRNHCYRHVASVVRTLRSLVGGDGFRRAVAKAEEAEKLLLEAMLSLRANAGDSDTNETGSSGAALELDYVNAFAVRPRGPCSSAHRAAPVCSIQITQRPRPHSARSAFTGPQRVPQPAAPEQTATQPPPPPEALLDDFDDLPPPAAFDNDLPLPALDTEWTLPPAAFATPPEPELHDEMLPPAPQEPAPPPARREEPAPPPAPREDMLPAPPPPPPPVTPAHRLSPQRAESPPPVPPPTPREPMDVPPPPPPPPPLQHTTPSSVGPSADTSATPPRARRPPPKRTHAVSRGARTVRTRPAPSATQLAARPASPPAPPAPSSDAKAAVKAAAARVRVYSPEPEAGPMTGNDAEALADRAARARQPTMPAKLGVFRGSTVEPKKLESIVITQQRADLNVATPNGLFLAVPLKTAHRPPPPPRTARKKPPPPPPEPSRFALPPAPEPPPDESEPPDPLPPLPPQPSKPVRPRYSVVGKQSDALPVPAPPADPPAPAEDPRPLHWAAAAEAKAKQASKPTSKPPPEPLAPPPPKPPPAKRVRAMLADETGVEILFRDMDAMNPALNTPPNESVRRKRDATLPTHLHFIVAVKTWRMGTTLPAAIVRRRHARTRSVHAAARFDAYVYTYTRTRIRVRVVRRTHERAHRADTLSRSLRRMRCTASCPALSFTACQGADGAHPCGERFEHRRPLHAAVARRHRPRPPS
jgi:hypothetical protein